MHPKEHPGTKPPHICPAWAGPLLCCPLRRLFERPETLIEGCVLPGMTVLEPGCGMGYFTLPIARIAGPTGRVVAVDIQPKMLEGLVRRARRAGLSDQIEAVACTAGDLGLAQWAGHIDVAIAIHVLHEVDDRQRFLEQVFVALRPGGRLLLLEPKGHVPREALAGELALSTLVGFRQVEARILARSHGALLEKPQVPPAASGT
ncbi:MAG: Ubiquinone/menaquinone biosynthesis C-methyltransferase UbiE [Thermoanaerobaculia bacterium]|nr:Ubiquinone/menaquinone biosynthesis C-methyltransferase UbiE [Thermoanaerobaculia bacterium]